MITAKYFSEREFNKCTPSCSLQDMNQEFMDTMDRIREIAGIPLVINCAYRSKEHDLAKGRSGNSSHTRGLALDIRCNSSQNRNKILEACHKVGITRLGIGKNFIHIDTDKSLTQNITWLY